MQFLGLSSGSVALLLVLLANSSGTKNSTNPSREKPERNKTTLVVALKGEWSLQQRVVRGQPMDDQPGLHLRVSDREMSLVRVDGWWWKSTTPVSNQFYRLNSAKEPARIDTAGRTDWSDVSEGICRVEEDILSLCFAGKNQARPTKFSSGTETGMGEVLMIFKRVGKSRK
jgi:uncharacterized protein (TIGR03067 family)